MSKSGQKGQDTKRKTAEMVCRHSHVTICAQNNYHCIIRSYEHFLYTSLYSMPSISFCFLHIKYTLAGKLTPFFSSSTRIIILTLDNIRTLFLHPENNALLYKGIGVGSFHSTWLIRSLRQHLTYNFCLQIVVS